MNIVQLENNCPVWIEGARRIECVAGWIWLTRTGGAGDVFLRSGETLDLAPADRVLVEGLGPAQVRVISRSSGWHDICHGVMAVLSFSYERLRTMRFARRRTPLAG